MKKIRKNIKSTKKIFVIFSIAIIGLIIGYISKSYAIYKLQKDFNIMKNQIGTYKTGDYSVAVLVDGKETDTFPSYETNYKVESVDCTNGVTATFDVENWQLNIADMSSTSCKCTVSFNSKEKNKITPIAMTKKEILALNEDIKNTSAKELANYLYPVGSIYMSTEDDTIDKVENKFGGTWVKYSEGTMLMGANDSYTVNSTGGSSTVTLTNANLPAHNHSIPALSGTASGGNHRHSISNDVYNGGGSGYSSISVGSGSALFYYNGTYYTQYSGNLSLSVSTTASNTNGCTNCSATAVDVLNPYTAIYMYKRTA